LDKVFTLHAHFVARMLRPYKNRGSFPEITKEGFNPPLLEDGVSSSVA
jgi:hypothetical protein